MNLETIRRSGFGMVLAFVAILLAVSGDDRSKPGVPKPLILETPRADRPDDAARFRWLQRIDEHGEIPVGALINAQRQREEILNHERPQGDGGILPNSWKWLGPGNIGGRVRSLAINPSYPSVIYAGSAGGGVWKTTDGGASWGASDGQGSTILANLVVSCLAMDPGNPNIVYAGTGEAFFTSDGDTNYGTARGAGIFKSSDAGATWAALQDLEDLPATWRNVYRIAVNPINPNVVLAATGKDTLISVDSGAHWGQTSWPDETPDVRDVDFHPTEALGAVAGSGYGEAYWSADGGLSWTAATPSFGGGRVELAYAPSDPSVVYASVNVNDGELWRSDNGGRSYARQATGYSFFRSVFPPGTNQGNYDNAIWVDPTNPFVVVVGGIDLWRTTDGGANFLRISLWQQAPLSPHADHHYIIHSPLFDGVTNKEVFFANDGGIYRTTDVYSAFLTIGWTPLNNSLGVTQFYGATVNQQTGAILGGTQDNGTLRYNGGTNSWTSLLGGDGGYCASDPVDSTVFYVEHPYAEVYRSENGGVNAQDISQDLADANEDGANFIAPLLLDPNNPGRLYVGAKHLWRSDDAKTGMPPDWIATTQEFSPHISAVAVASGDSQTIWVGLGNNLSPASGAVYVTHDGGANWTRVDDSGPSSLPNRWVNRIVIDPSDPEGKTVYVAFGGYAYGNVWKTVNGGQSWANISQTLVEAPVNALTLNPLHPNIIYAGTDVGIFATSDGGLNWSTNNAGPANVEVDDLIWKNSDTLIAVTHGRGMYEAKVRLKNRAPRTGDGNQLPPPPPPGLAPWPMFRHDRQHTARSPYLGATVGDLNWRFQTSGNVVSPPSVGPDGTIYVGTSGNTFYAINPNGSLRWSYTTSAWILSSAAIGDDGSIYFGCQDGKIYALRADGTAKWAYQTGSYVLSSPVLGVNGLIYVASHDGYLYCLAPNGSLNWRTVVGSRPVSSPAIGQDGTIYVGATDDFALVAVNANGSIKWTYQTGNYVDSSPSVGADGTIYFSSSDGNCYAINPNGSLRWRVGTTGGTSSPAIGVDGTIYVGADNGSVYALRPDGLELWRFQTGGWIDASPAISANGIVYISSFDGYLYAIRPDGELAWRYLTSGGGCSPAISRSGTIYVGGQDGGLYSVGRN